MKKVKIKVLISLLLFTIFSGVFFSACSFNIGTKVKQQMSELSKVLFYGENEEIHVTLTSGYREQPFEYDGISNERVDFCVIDIVFKQANNLDDIDAMIKVNEKTQEITLEKNPFKSSFMNDLQKSVDETDKISLTFNEKEIGLKCKSKDFKTTYEKALNIGIEAMQDKLKNLQSRGKLKAECYLKIISNVLQNKELFYWYFSVKGQNGSTYSVIIDPSTGSVLAKY